MGPAGYRDRIRLWQAVSAARRLAVLIDDAPSAAVIAALRPSTGLAVVTSRRALGGRHGVITRVRVGPLRRRPAAALLASEQGRSAAGPGRASELARLCGGLPLALRCAARLAGPAGLPAAELAEQLEAGQARLIARGIPPAGARARAVIEAAIGTLTAENARALRLLSLCPGPEISPGLAAAVLSAGRGPAGAALVQLGQPATAVRWLRHAAAVWQQIGDDAQLAAAHRAYGQALMALHRPADAAT